MNNETTCPCCLEARVACCCGLSGNELSPEEWAAANIPNDPENVSDCSIEIRVEASSCIGDSVSWNVLSWLSSVLKDQGHKVSTIDVQGERIVGILAPYDPKARPPVVPREFRIVRVMGKRPGRWERIKNRFIAWRARKREWPQSSDGDGCPLFVRAKSRQKAERASRQMLRPLMLFSSNSAIRGKSELKVMCLDEVEAARPSKREKKLVDFLYQRAARLPSIRPVSDDEEPPAAAVSAP